MPYIRTSNNHLGSLGDGFNLTNSESGEGVSFAQCQAIINHQAPGGLETQFACASKGWHGNAAWPIPQPVTAAAPQQLQLAVQPTIIQPPATPLPPLAINPVPPSLFEETVNTIPDCSGLDTWIADNKVLALGIVALVYFVR
jgi:hypothetical protein